MAAVCCKLHYQSQLYFIWSIFSYIKYVLITQLTVLETNRGRINIVHVKTIILNCVIHIHETYLCEFLLGKFVSLKLVFILYTYWNNSFRTKSWNNSFRTNFIISGYLIGLICIRVVWSHCFYLILPCQYE